MTSKEWKTYKLSDFMEFNPRETLTKGTIAKKIAMENLQPFCRDVCQYEYAPYNGGVKFKNGDTIMARITPCLENGKTSKVNILEDNEIAFGSTEYIVFRKRDNISDENFIYYLVTSPKIREIAIKSMVGSSGRQRVQADVLANLELELPPLETQEKIARVLSSLDDKIELNNKINQNLEQQAQAIFKSWFVDFEPFGGKIPEDWKVGNLYEIANITMGQSPDGKSYNENGYGEVFYQGRAEFGSRYPTRRLYTTEPKRMANAGDILMSVRAPVGDINVALEQCCIGRGLASISSRDNFNSFILYTLMNLKRAFDIYNAEGTVFGAINKDSLNSIEVIIPIKKEIYKFEEIASNLDKKIRQNTIEVQKLQKIRDTLLPKLMSGEIDVDKVEV